MKRFFALILALVSGGYLLTMGPIPDPLPIVDEAIMLMIFVQALAALGLDIRGWLPFFGKKMPEMQRARAKSPQEYDRTIDV